MWSINSEDYIKAAVNTIRTSIQKKNKWKIPKNPRTPMQITDTTPKLDTSPELGPSDITLYQEMIGMFRWATELGRVDILHEISI